MTKRTCTVGDCTNDTSKGANELCGMHYARKRRGSHVGPDGYIRPPNRTVEDRIFPRLTEDLTTGCWDWQGALRNGYGAVGIGTKIVYVHRWIYEHFIAPIPDGLIIDHLCINRRCANPEHLDVVTRAINNARGGRNHGTRKEKAA